MSITQILEVVRVHPQELRGQFLLRQVRLVRLSRHKGLFHCMVRYHRGLLRMVLSHRMERCCHKGQLNMVLQQVSGSSDVRLEGLDIVGHVVDEVFDNGQHEHDRNSERTPMHIGRWRIPPLSQP